jgi:hypothetical protein
MRDDGGPPRDDFVTPGDLVFGTHPFARVYFDDQCGVWEDYVRGTVGVCLEVCTNSWEQTVVKILFPQGIRWLYLADVAVVCVNPGCSVLRCEHEGR